MVKLNQIVLDRDTRRFSRDANPSGFSAWHACHSGSTGIQTFSRCDHSAIGNPQPGTLRCISLWIDADNRLAGKRRLGLPGEFLSDRVSIAISF